MAEADVIVKHIITQSIRSRGRGGKGRKGTAGLRLLYSLPGICRFRVNIASERFVCDRPQGCPYEIPTAESLGLPKVVNDIALEERGLILVTGVTGSGKSRPWHP